jgi:hypothetical protein
MMIWFFFYSQTNNLMSQPHPKSQQPSSSSSSLFPLPLPLWIVVGIGGFRILGALLQATAHSADEYWQSLEVAHYLAFEYPLFIYFLL